MAKPIRLKPVKISENKWRLNIHKKFSPTGKRQRLFFESRREADMEAERLKSITELHGVDAKRLPASQTEDAAKAFKILEEYGSQKTLSELATDYVDHQKRLSASKKFSEVWASYRDHLDTAVNSRGKKTSEVTKINKERFIRPILEIFKDTLIAEITADNIEKAFKSSYRTPSQFNSAKAHISPVWAYACHPRRKWCSENIVAEIDRQAEAEKETTVATPGQVSAALAACRDHTENENLPEHLRVDASDAVPAIAILAFAGVRPDRELPSLEWPSIDLNKKTIRISKRSAKGKGGRRIPIEYNLLEWLEAVPEHERFGSVAPANWRRKWQLVRKLAGFEKGDTDILRHSYASYYYHGKSDDLHKLRANLGHDTTEVVFQHYLDCDIDPDIAAKFWRITPTENEVELEATA